MSDSSNRTFEVLEYLVGMYDVPVAGVIRFRLCTAKGYGRLDTAGMSFRAHKDGEAREIFPMRLDVAREYVSMRVSPDVLPKGWLGKCSISLICRKPFVCYPTASHDISDSVRPEPKRSSIAPQEAASP